MKIIICFLSKISKKNISREYNHLKCINEIKRNIYLKEKELNETYPFK